MSIYEEVEIEDMEWEEEEQQYTYPCPCGDKFIITLVRFIHHAGDQVPISIYPFPLDSAPIQPTTTPPGRLKPYCFKPTRHGHRHRPSCGTARTWPRAPAAPSGSASFTTRRICPR